jgi:hypothetical protein
MAMRGRPFEPGNTMGKGRPPGSRNKRTVFMELMDRRGESIIRHCQVMALEHDRTAMRLCMERLLPPCRASNQQFRLQPGATTEDLVKTLDTVMRQVARGHVSPQDGESIARMIEIQRRAIETDGIERRLRALEEKNPNGAQAKRE